MPLSYDERKQLEEMEKQIRSEDPAFARKLGARKPATSYIVPSWPGGLLILAGWLVLLTGITTQLPLIGITGFLLIITGGYQHVREPDSRLNSGAAK